MNETTDAPADGDGGKAESKELSQAGGKASGVMYGSAGLDDGEVHVGVELRMKTGGKPTSLMVPDATKVSADKGGKPVFLTGPMAVEFTNLNVYLQKKGTPLPSELSGFMEATTLTCDAFYYSAGPKLMSFSLDFTNSSGKKVKKEETRWQ